MNFFRKKDHIFVSFVESELKDSDRKLRENLLGLFPIHQGTEVRLNIVDAADIPLKSLAVLISFAARLHSEGIHIVLVANPAVAESIRLLDFGGQFDSIQEEVKSNVR